MSYRLVNANDLSDKYPEVNDMDCIYTDLPNGLDNQYYKIGNYTKEEIISAIEKMTFGTSENKTIFDVLLEEINKLIENSKKEQRKMAKESGWICGECMHFNHCEIYDKQNTTSPIRKCERFKED